MAIRPIYFYITAIMVLRFDQSDAYDRLWAVDMMDAPTVQVEMLLNYTNGNRSMWITDKMHSVSSFKRLIVPLGSTLFLTCNSRDSDPVVWMKNGVQFTDTDNRNHAGDRVPNQSQLGIINVTFDVEGKYRCSVILPHPNMTAEESLQTNFEVIVQRTAMTDEVSEPLILTPIFDEVQLKLGFWAPNTLSALFRFTVIAPAEIEYKEYLLSPGNEFEELYSPIGYQRLRSGIEIHLSQHSTIRDTWETNLTLPSDYQYNGTYTYIIQYKSSNGSWLNVSRSLTVLPRQHARRPEVELTAWDTSQLTLPLGGYYTLSNYDLVGDFAETLEILSPSLTSCDLIDVPTEAQYDMCGVMDVRVIDNTYRNRPGKEYRIRVKVVRRCAFRLQMWSEERKLDITKTVDVKPVENGREPIAGEEIVSFFTTDGARDNAEKYINETLSIECRFPACGWEMIALCKQGVSMDCVRLRRENITDYVFSERFLKSKISIAFVHLTNLTLALKLNIGKLELRHAGVYECGELQSSYTQSEYSRNEEMAFPEIWRQMHFINFRLAVLKPQAPEFLDDHSMFQESLLNGGEAVLYCPFTGSPEPLIIWTKHRAYVENLENGTDVLSRLEMPEYTNKTTITVRDIGTYECSAKNRFGENSRKFKVKVPDRADSQPASPLPIALSVTAAAILMAFTVAVVIWQRRRTKKVLFKELAQLLCEPSAGVQLDDVLPLNDQADILPYNTNYEIARDRFQLIKVIGDGEFGQVYRGELQTNENQRRYVAVKVPKNPLKPEHHQALISELKIMIYLRPHVNVLALVGACTNELEQRQRLFVLTEYCEKGSLLSYLQDHVLDYESQAPSFGIQSLIDFAYQAANGMEQLATWKIIHRDLAVRNLLLTHRGVIKIADFGLSRQKETIYSYNKFLFRNLRLPVAWMAPESVTRYEYTHKSDVWSFGIVLWEIFSCGQAPYSSEDVSGMDIIPWLREGNRLSMPALATNEMYSLMLDCWSADPASRPTFPQCKGRIARHLEDKFPSSYTSLLLLLSDSFCQMGTVRQASSTALSQEIPIDPSADQREEHVAIEMGSEFLVNLSGDSCSLSSPASFDYVTSAGTSEAGGEINTAFDDEEPENGYVTSADNVLSVDAVFDQEELPEQQDAHDDTPLLG